MLLRYIAISLFILYGSAFSVFAQDTYTSMITDEMEMLPPKPKRFYWSNGVDGALFQTSLLSRPGRSNVISTLRFSYFFNFGLHLNYDKNDRFGLFTGLGIRNLGFIDKVKDSTIKHRVYAIDIPLGIKIGNLNKRNFALLGGGINLPFNYKEKGFISRSHKEKMNEWFSGRTPFVMPYVFIGHSFNPGTVVRLQYYPGNFMNPSYSFSNGINTFYPYAGYDVHLMMISLGIDLHYKNTSLKGIKEKGIVKRIM